MTDYLDQVAQLLQRVPRGALTAIADHLWRAYCADAQIFACGNGGSSATASHFVEDLSKGIDLPPGAQRFRVISLVDSVPTLTAYANDLGYDCVFCEPLRNLARRGDVLFAISGSGRSQNVLRAMEAAKEIGATVVALGGRDGGEMVAVADLCLVAPVESMQQIEDAHLAITHAIYLDLKARAETADRATRATTAEQAARG
jgi:D-sedoheptulose 7-phosphate isomerase